MTTPSEAILNKLRSLKPALAARGVTRLRVFGSVARGEAREDSDVDLIVDFEKVPDLFKYTGLWLDLKEMMGRDVDMTTERALHPLLRERILAEARDV